MWITLDKTMSNKPNQYYIKTLKIVGQRTQTNRLHEPFKINHLMPLTQCSPISNRPEKTPARKDRQQQAPTYCWVVGDVDTGISHTACRTVSRRN